MNAKTSTGFQLFQPGLNLACLFLVSYVIHSCLYGKLVGQEPQQTFEIAGYKNIYRWTHRFPVAMFMSFRSIYSNAALSLNTMCGLLLIVVYLLELV
jgi:hypothetical protein